MSEDYKLIYNILNAKCYMLHHSKTKRIDIKLKITTRVNMIELQYFQAKIPLISDI